LRDTSNGPAPAQPEFAILQPVEADAPIDGTAAEATGGD
jgi:hypothetical protein